jgi:hypothetical protein
MAIQGWSIRTTNLDTAKSMVRSLHLRALVVMRSRKAGVWDRKVENLQVLSDRTNKQGVCFRSRLGMDCRELLKEKLLE